MFSTRLCLHACLNSSRVPPLPPVGPRVAHRFLPRMNQTWPRPEEFFQAGTCGMTRRESVLSVRDSRSTSNTLQGREAPLVANAGVLNLKAMDLLLVTT